MATNITPRRTGFSLLGLTVAISQAILLGYTILFIELVVMWGKHGNVIAMHNAIQWQQQNEQRLQIVLQHHSEAIQHFFNTLMNKIHDDSHRAFHQMTTQLTESSVAMNHELTISENRNDNETKKQVNHFYQSCQTMLALLLITSNIVLIQLLMLLLATPLFLLSMVVGLSEGLMLRAIRKASLGRESAYLFHQWSRLLPTGMAACVLILMLLPSAASPQVGLVIMAAMLGLGLSQTVSRFKKYV